MNQNFLIKVMFFLVLVLVIFGAYKLGVFAEKIGQLEDCVFNQKGCYSNGT